MADTNLFDGFTVDLKHYPAGIWDFARSVRTAATDALLRIHARDLAAEVALLKDGSDVGVYVHPPQPPIEIALRNRDIYRSEIPYGRYIPNPYRFTAHAFIGKDETRPFVHLDAEDPLYFEAIANLDGTERFRSPIGDDGDPVLVQSLNDGRTQNGLGVAIDLRRDTSDLRRSWERTDGFVALVLREQPTVSDRVYRLSNTVVKPRVRVREDLLSPLTEKDLYQYTRQEHAEA